MELLAKRLRRGQHIRMRPFPGIVGKDRRAGKAKQMVILESLDDLGVHIPKLATVTLVKDDHTVFVEHFMPLVPGHKIVQFLNRRDDDFISMKRAFVVPVFELSLQDFCRGIAVGRSFFEPVVFFHGLIVEIFSIHHK